MGWIYLDGLSWLDFQFPQLIKAKATSVVCLFAGSDHRFFWESVALLYWRACMCVCETCMCVCVCEFFRTCSHYVLTCVCVNCLKRVALPYWHVAVCVCVCVCVNSLFIWPRYCMCLSVFHFLFWLHCFSRDCLTPPLINFHLLLMWPISQSTLSFGGFLFHQQRFVWKLFLLFISLKRIISGLEM